MPLIFNMDGTKMSKRDKAKTARAELQKRVKEAGDAYIEEHLSHVPRLRDRKDEIYAFLRKENDSVELAEILAAKMLVPLPEIEVSDFREAGYLPEAITNFLGLLGWNPGMKTPDGKDLEKFDRDFLAHHFSLERIGRTNAKFDRAKLASFNGDYLAALPEDQYAARFEHWLRHERVAPDAHNADIRSAVPDALERVLADPVRRAALVAAVRPRAKTIADVWRACTFVALRSDGSAAFDAAALDKHLKANSGAGLALLREFRERLAALAEGDVTPASVTALIDAFARDKAFPNPGPIAQPLRVALTGSAVSPGLGETITILGKQSALTRIDACLAACA
jgi:glutamyl-tRNA synthetase